MKPKARQRPTPKSNQRPRGVLLFLLTVGLGVYLLKLYADVDRQYAAIHAQAVAAELKVDTAEATNTRLREQAAALHTDAEIEKQARERLGLIRAGEVPVIVQPKSGD